MIDITFFFFLSEVESERVERKIDTLYVFVYNQIKENLKGCNQTSFKKLSFGNDNCDCYLRGYIVSEAR